jgi:hypothetical protein
MVLLSSFFVIAHSGFVILPHSFGIRHSCFVIQIIHSSFVLRHCNHACTGTLAVRSSLPQLTQAPLSARKIAFQMQ